MRTLMTVVLALTVVALADAGGPASAGLHSASPSSLAAAQGEWKEAVDLRSGRTYYWNTVTRESRWTKPSPTQSKSKAAAAPLPPAAPASRPTVEEDDDPEAEEKYTPGEADMEEYTIRNPSRPGRGQLTRMRESFARRTEAARSALRSRDSSEREGRRPAILQGVYLGAVLAAAAAFL